MYKVQHDLQGFWTTVLNSEDKVSCMLSSVMFSKLHECDRNYRVVDESGEVQSYDAVRMLRDSYKGSIGKDKFKMEVYDHKNITFLTVGERQFKGSFYQGMFISDDGQTIYVYDETNKKQPLKIAD